MSKKRDFSNDTLLKDFTEVFKGMESKEINLVVSRLHYLMIHWFLVYKMPSHLRLKFCEASIKMYLFLNKYRQFGDDGFTRDVMDYILSCFDRIENKVKCSN